MQKSKNLSILFLLLYFLASCNNRKSTEFLGNDFPKTISLDLSEATAYPLKLSDIAEKIEYIPLQTVDNALLGSLSCIVVTKDNFFIQTDDSSMVYRYDKEGRFLNRMFKVGRGPGETIPLSFTVDDTRKQLYVLTSREELYVYDYNGNFIKKIDKLKVDPVDYTISLGFFNNTLFYAQMPDPKIKYIHYCQDLNNDSIIFHYKNPNDYGKFNENISPKMFSLSDYNYQITDSSVLFKERFCDTIFGLDKSFIAEPRYIIELGNQKLKWEDYRDIFVFHEGPITPQFKFPNGYWIASHTETELFIFFVIRSHNDPQLFCIYNKNTGLIKISKRRYYDNIDNQVYIENDLDRIVAFPPMNKRGRITYYDECLYYNIEAIDFVNDYKSASDEIKNSSDYLKKMAPILSSITDFSNTIIMKVYLK